MLRTRTHLFAEPLDSLEVSDGSIAHCYHKLHWSVWMFEVSGYDLEKSFMKFGRGGFQDTRGDTIWNGGSDW